MPMLVTLGNNGSRDWMRGRLARIYGKRHDMLPMLKSAKARGRPYVLLATDELIPGKLIYNDAPIHIVGLRTEAAKLGTYATWLGRTTQIKPGTMELEFYDYATEAGLLELTNAPHDPRARRMLKLLLDRLIPDELQQRLPGLLGLVQDVSRKAYLLLAQQVLDSGTNAPARSGLTDLGYGREF
jgi:uncharacterized sulfatase